MNDALDRLTAALADRYAIEHEIGAGGMATVYLAEDVKHHRQVAIKVLKPDLAAALGPERFLREIEIAARLRHPHILPLYDSGEADGFLYYVMPYVRGESLRERLQREKQLPVEDGIRIAREVADALSYAHTEDVVHRDIKPENIMLEAGHAVVADFGIARAIDAAGGEQLTETGMAVGTPAYMSPEQASGESGLDGRSDLYSLGCVLYEMLAGQPPFTGPTIESLVHQHLAVDPPPITNLRPAVPSEIIGVLARTLAKSPADRFSPVTQFAEALGHVPLTGAGAPAQAASAPVRERQMPRIVVGAVVVMLVVAAVGLLRTTGGRDPASDTPSLAVLPFVALGGDEVEYLGDGIAETLINALANLEGLQVAARTSAFSFKGTSADVRTIGRDLGVGAVLEGSVQRAGDRIRVTAQLIDATNGFHLWSQSFDRDVGDVFAVQDEVARAVAGALRVTLLGEPEAPVVDEGTTNLTAYDAYLLGRFHWNKRTAADLELAAKFYDDAIAADSAYARAWAGLAEAYNLFHPSEYEVASIPWPEAARRGEAAARQALNLDSTSVEAYTALAAILEKQKRFAEAERMFQRAINIDPQYPTAHQWYGGLLLSLGRLDEGLREFQTAVSLDPLSFVISLELVESLDAVGRTDEATTLFNRLAAEYDDAPLIHMYGSMHFMVTGDIDRAAGHFDRTYELFSGDPVQDSEKLDLDPSR